jgi:polysaccharide export outer membrane protein
LQPPAGEPGYAIVDLTPSVVQALAEYHPAGLAARFGASGYAPTLTLLPGDQVAITIFDVSSQPLFGAAAGGSEGSGPTSPIAGHVTTIPPQVVELDGSVKIPYGGEIKIAGLTPAVAAGEIEEALKGQAHAPQVVVSLQSSPLESVTVGGDVARPGVIPLTVRGERVLDVIAAAGGCRFEPFDCAVQLVRNGKPTKMALQDIVDDAAENVAMAPGDSLYLLHDPRTFTVLGSATKVAQYNFDTEQVTLAEAVGRAGGPNDALSGIQNIYLLRFEARALAGRFAGGALRAGAKDDARVAVAYRIDLRRGGGYFLAQAVQLRDKDVILMTNADAVQLQKLLTMVRGVTGVYYDIKRSSGR